MKSETLIDGVATLAPLRRAIRLTRPYRPQTNGKAERFIKTLLAEWAYGRLYRTNDERIDALPEWVTYYNTERTHTALGGITPMDALVNNLHGNHSGNVQGAGRWGFVAKLLKQLGRELLKEMTPGVRAFGRGAP